MTDRPDTDQPDQFDHGPDLALPERLPLDPYSAAVLAVNAELERQIPGDTAVVVDPDPITRAALDAGGNIPRIPDWDAQPRTIGGRTIGGQDPPDPEITVVGPTDTGDVTLSIVATIEGTDRVLGVGIPATDAEAWFLAGLAAVRAARTTPADLHTDTG